MGVFGPNIEKMKSERDIQGLIEALRHKKKEIRIESAAELAIIGVSAVEPLIKTLKDDDEYDHGYAIGALVSIGAFAVEPLIKALKDHDSNVRENTAWALGNIGNKRAVEPLIKAL